jgi:hypothetical protein
VPSYTLTPLSNGLSARSLSPGDSFALDMVLTSDTGAMHTSSVFDVGFSGNGLSYSPGIVYQSYTWASPYDNGTIDDDSHPLYSALPQTITGTKVNLSNVMPMVPVAFHTGTLVTLNFTIPSNYQLGTTLQTITFSAQPDQFYNGTDEVPTTAGTNFILTIIPEPASVLVLLAGIAGLKRKRIGA